MEQSKKFVFSVLLLTLVLALAACGGSKGSAGNGGDDDWLDSANLEEEETMDELYAKAQEEGELIVYSSSSVVTNVVTNFEKDYPGINVNATKLNDVDVTERIKREQESEVYEADVVFSSGNNGAIERELLDAGLAHVYNPSVISDQLIPPYDEDPILNVTAEAYAVMYNTEKYDEPPIDNWWDLTTPEWKGKVLSNDPLSSANLASLFLSFIQYSDEMEEAYKEKFGEDIVLDGTENAGYEFIKRLMDNDLVLLKSGGDAVDGVALSEDELPPIAIASTVSLRDVVNHDYNIAIVEDIKPRLSSPILKSFLVANNANNVNAAKLFIRYMSGGDDGDAAGFDPLNTPGTWPLREDVEQDLEGIVSPYDELEWWERDDEFIYENTTNLRNFLLEVQ